MGEAYICYHHIRGNPDYAIRTVVKWIAFPDSHLDRCYPLLVDLWKSTLALMSLEAAHIYREGKSVIDWLTSYVVNHLGSFVWGQHLF